MVFSFAGFFALKVLHIIAMALLFATSLGTAWDLRTVVPLGMPHTEALVVRIDRRVRFTAVTGGVTMLTGILLVAMSGGLHGTPWRIWLGFALAIVSAGLGGGVLGGLWKELSPLLKSGTDAAAAQALSRRFLAIDRVVTGMWVTIVILMVVPFE